MTVDVTPIVPAGRQLIEAYGDGGFRISGTRYDGSVIVFPDRTMPWPISRIEDLSEPMLQAVLESDRPVEVLLVGCGRKAAFLAKPLRDALRARGVVVESMDSGAACRTYNVLMSEDREVAAALIAVE